MLGYADWDRHRSVARARARAGSRARPPRLAAGGGRPRRRGPHRRHGGPARRDRSGRRRDRRRPPRGARRGRRRADRPRREQRQRAGAEPAAGPRRLPARRAPARVRGERHRSARARAACAPAPRARRRGRERDLGRRRRAVRGLGRLRLVEGRARAALGDPRGRAHRPARVHGRPRRHAHADAAGGVPGRGHLGPPAARAERAGADRADRGLNAERALPRARCRGGPLVNAPAALPALDAAEQETALLVAHRSDGSLAHTRFDRLGDHLRAGDLLVVNNSATVPAALPALLHDKRVELRLSTPAADGRWLVELRSADLRPLAPPPLPARVELPGGAHADLLAPYLRSRRLSIAALELRAPVLDYLRLHGRPIRYLHSERVRPIEHYQTVFALEPGSAEMPSAARPFTPALVAELVARGVLLAPITLHAGVSSLELGEDPYPERYRVPPTTAWLVNSVRANGGRVIAIGTTVVRALETTARRDGTVAAGDGHTEVVVTPERGLRAVDGLLTGWHEPESSHLKLLEAAAGRPLLERSYRVARGHGYAWHEFGDSHLILP